MEEEVEREGEEEEEEGVCVMKRSGSSFVEPLGTQTPNRKGFQNVLL